MENHCMQPITVEMFIGLIYNIIDDEIRILVKVASAQEVTLIFKWANILQFSANILLR